MKTLYIYADKGLPKLNYVFDFVFQQLLSLDYKVISNLEIFTSAPSQPRLNYSRDYIKGVISIVSSDYFSEFKMSIIPKFESDLLFLDDKSNFDVFAAIFYLLARVEEYTSTKIDEHNRFPSSASQLVAKNLLQIPVVDKWVESLRTQLNSTYKFALIEPSYSATSTIDIDHIYAYKGKSTLMSLGSMGKDMLTLQGSKLKARLGKDPFDTYASMIKSNKDNGFAPTFFMLTAERAQYDKSFSPSHPLFMTKVMELSSQYELGIHPSYQSNEDVKLLTQEITNLSTLTNQRITKSRQHYLKMRLPQTYRNLLENGIEEDYTMGYADSVGFRAGTSQPFYWYDLESDKVTTLKVIPFCIMDVTLRKYLGHSPDAAIGLIEDLVSSIRAVGGHCCFIWHNSSFYAAEGWSGWDKVYTKLLQIARP